jgi:starvation-inducible outer membrane lipoprotein
MKKIIVTILVATMVFVMTGCNAVAKNWGGTATVDLEPGRKFVDITWKEDSLWVLTKQMGADDVAETYYFEEDANFGILEGTVIIREHKE